MLVSAGLVAFLARQLDFAQIRTILDRPGGWPWLLGAILLFNASKIVSALRLNIYQRHVGVALTEGQNLRLYYAGMFLNLFLPGGIGGDGYKIFVLNRQQSVPVKKLVLVTLADRVSGLLCLLFLLCGLAPWAGLDWPLGSVTAGATASAGFIATGAVIGHRLVFSLDGKSIGTILGLGVTVQMLQLICMALLLSYVGLPLTQFPAYLAIFLLSSVVAVLPISLGGLGAREVTFFYCIKLLGLDPTLGVVVSSCFFLISMLSSMVGAIFLHAFSARRSLA